MIIKNSIIPRLSSVFINVYAITLWPFVFIRDEGNPRVINHESIHLKQQKELLLVGFYLLYVIFWVVGIFKYRSTQIAYYEIPFEREAYNHDGDYEYLNNRKLFAWTKYISSSGPEAS